MFFVNILFTCLSVVVFFSFFLQKKILKIELLEHLPKNNYRKIKILKTITTKVSYRVLFYE